MAVAIPAADASSASSNIISNVTLFSQRRRANPIQSAQVRGLFASPADAHTVACRTEHSRSETFERCIPDRAGNMSRTTMHLEEMGDDVLKLLIRLLCAQCRPSAQMCLRHAGKRWLDTKKHLLTFDFQILRQLFRQQVYSPPVALLQTQCGAVNR